VKCVICKGTGDEKVYYDESGSNYETIVCRSCNGVGHLKPKVLNKHIHGLPKDAIYIGRGSEWGNPFKIGPDGTRDEVIDKYVKWFMLDSNRVNRARVVLKGKNLVCYCSPNRCHGDFLITLANKEN
jgi:hypothetical protein